jgi:hypothetical protein
MADLQPVTLANAGTPGILPDKTINPWQVLRGSNLGQEGAGLQDVAQKGSVMLNNYNEGVVNSLLPQIQKSLMDQRDRAQTLQGQNVLNAGTDDSGNAQNYHQSALAAFDQATQTALGQAKNDQQRQSLQQQAARMRVDLDAFTAAHQNIQMHQASIQGTDSALKGDSNLMAQAMQIGDKDAFGNHYSSLEDHIAQLAALKGLDPDTAKLDRQNILSDTYGQVINAMLTSGRPGAYKDAQDFFNGTPDQPGVKNDMTPAAQAKVHDLIQAYTVPQQGLDAAKATWQNHPAPAGSDPRYYMPPIADMATEINNRTDLDPKVKEHAISQLHQMWSFQKDQAEDLVKTVEGNAFSNLIDKKMPISAIMQAPDVVSMPGTARESLQTKMEGFVKRNQSDPAVQSSQYVALVSEFEKADQDPNYWQTHSLQTIKGMGWEVGPKGVEALADAHEKAMNPKPGKPVPVTSWDDMLHMVEARVANAQVEGTPGMALPSLKEKGALGAFVENLRATQQRSGQVWSMDNTNKLIDEQMGNIVTGKAFFGSDPHQPLWQVQDQVPAWFMQTQRQNGLNAHDAAQAFFDLKGQHAFDVPPAYASQVADYAVSKGLPVPTADQLAQHWFMKNRGGKLAGAQPSYLSLPLTAR